MTVSNGRCGMLSATIRGLEGRMAMVQDCLLGGGRPPSGSSTSTGTIRPDGKSDDLQRYCKHLYAIYDCITRR